MNIDFKKVGFGVACLFVAYKSFSKNKTADAALAGLGAVVLAKQVPVVGAMI